MGPQLAAAGRGCVAQRVMVAVGISAITGGAIGLLVLVGWAADLPQLRSVLPGAVEMKANTAIGLVATGAALQLLALRHSRAGQGAGLALAAAVTLLGLATLGQYLFGWTLQIDELVFLDRAGSYNLIRGRMSPYTAVAFAALGGALLLLPFPRLNVLGFCTALATLVIGAVSAVGYVWNASELTTDVLLPPVAIHTAVALVVLSIGTLLAIADRRGGAAAPPDSTPWIAAGPSLKSVQARILAGFIGSFLMLAIGGGFSYRTSTVFLDSARQVAQTQQVRASLGQLRSDLADAALAQRNFLITGRPQLLEQYGEAFLKIEADLGLLRRQVTDARQSQLLGTLGPVIDQLRDALERAIALYRGQGFDAARRLVESGQGIASMHTLRERIGQLELMAGEVLVARQAEAARFQRYMLGSMLLTLVVAGCTLGFLFYGIRRQIRARACAEQAMADARTAAEQSHGEADAANRAKSAFLAAMSHEIRTPMNGVLGLLELLSLTPLKGDQLSTLTMARESGRSLLRIVDDILDFSKIEANRLDLHPLPGSLAELAARVRDLHSGSASSRGLLLQSRVDERISPCLHFDSLRVEQILNNLLGNAIKFTERGSVELAVALVGRQDGVEELRFTVRDTGIGIPAASLAHLFQPFVQADSGTSARFGGTGLGLVICRRLAELMGGSVFIDSEVGKGTTATVTIQLAQGHPDELVRTRARQSRDQLDALLHGRRAAPSPEQAGVDGNLVLVVDDHPTNRMVLRRQVNLLGYAAETAPDGLAAVEAWKSGRFAAIIADCNMPVMTGYEMARTIRAIEQRDGLERTPIFACTANALESEAAICLEAGMDDYLVKPLELAQLAQRLDHWLPLPLPLSPTAMGLNQFLLDEMSGGDKGTESAILQDFQRINADDAQLLRQSVQAGELARITHFSHRIRGACAMLGADELAQVCVRIETASRAGDLATVRETMSRFEDALDQLETSVDRRIHH